MLLSDSNVQDNHLDLLNAFVYAYEIYHKEMFNHPPKEFTKHEYNKTYILALDALGMLYKESGDFKEAIKVYEKIIRYDDEDRFGAKESILICYVLTGQMEKYDELLNSLPYDSVYYMTLMLYIKIITGDSFYKEYIDLLKRSPDLLDVLCDIKDIEDVEYDLPVHMFLADFQGFFNMTPGLLEPLKQMHLNQDKSK
jgi:tetratricopeptide (TPR) repeat protein